MTAQERPIADEPERTGTAPPATIPPPALASIQARRARARRAEHTMRNTRRQRRRLSEMSRAIARRSPSLAVIIGIAVVVLALNGFVLAKSIQTVRDHDKWVSHTNAVLAQLGIVSTSVASAENGARAYVLSGQERSLQPYTNAHAQMDDQLNQLRTQTADNPVQQERITNLKSLLTSELANLQTAVDLRRANQTSQAIQQLISDQSQRIESTITTLLEQIRTSERELLTDRDASAFSAGWVALITFLLSAVIDVGLVIAVYLLVRQGMRLREQIAMEQVKGEAQAHIFALEASNQRMNEFLGIAGHELRTPLTSAKLNVQMAGRRLNMLTAAEADTAIHPRDLEQLRHLFESASRQMTRQERLVSDLLDLSRLQAGKLEMRLARCDLAAIIQESVTEQRLLNPERQLTLALPPDVERVPIMADADRVGQVLANYLTNALKYSPPERPVTVTLQRAGRMARVAVHDEGPGLSREAQARIWERFYQAQGIEVQSGSGIGLGLGLYICREMIERHGGQTGVESVEGQGSTFWFTLPLAPEEA